MRDDVCHCGLGPEDHKYPGAAEHNYVPMRDFEPIEPNNCTRCNAGMPSFRVNHLCEECFAEESEEYDTEAEMD